MKPTAPTAAQKHLLQALPAAQVVSALGRLPAVWCDHNGTWQVIGGESLFGHEGVSLDHSNDPQQQTAFGVALLLDEVTGEHHWRPRLAMGWANQVDSPEAYGRAVAAMIARITTIAHVNRLARKCSVTVGTLDHIEWVRDRRGWWRVQGRDEDGLVYDGRPEWAPNTNDPHEALAYVMKLEGLDE